MLFFAASYLQYPRSRPDTREMCRRVSAVGGARNIGRSRARESRWVVIGVESVMLERVVITPSVCIYMHIWKWEAPALMFNNESIADAFARAISMLGAFGSNSTAQPVLRSRGHIGWVKVVDSFLREGGGGRVRNAFVRFSSHAKWWVLIERGFYDLYIYFWRIKMCTILFTI